MRPISAHWNAPNEAAAQTDKHVDRGLWGGAHSPACEPTPTPTLFLFSFFLLCPALCLFRSVHPRSLSWGTYQPEEEERRGGGGPSVSSSGEERKGAKGSRRRGRQDTIGTRAPFVFHSPSVQSNSLIYCRSPNWRCEGGCWTGDTKRTDAASRRWRAQWGRRRARRFPSQLSRQRDSTKTHTPPSSPSSSLLSSSKSTSSAADAAASLPPSLRRPLSPNLSSSAEEDGDAVTPADGLLALSLDSARRGCPSSGWRKSCF